MEFVKTSVENYASQKMDIRQLVVVLRMISIGKSKNPGNRLEDFVFEAPMPVCLWEWWPYSFLPSKPHASEDTKEF